MTINYATVDSVRCSVGESLLYALETRGLLKEGSLGHKILHEGIGTLRPENFGLLFDERKYGGDTEYHIGIVRALLGPVEEGLQGIDLSMIGKAKEHSLELRASLWKGIDSKMAENIMAESKDHELRRKNLRACEKVNRFYDRYVDMALQD